MARTASASTHNRDEMMAVTDGAWRDGVAARRDPATNELGSFPWQKWDTGSHSGKVYSLSPSNPELLTNGFQIQLKGWGAAVGWGGGSGCGCCSGAAFGANVKWSWMEDEVAVSDYLFFFIPSAVYFRYTMILMWFAIQRAAEASGLLLSLAEL